MAKSKKRAGRDDRATRASETQELLNGKPGRVVAHHGVAVLVRFDDGVERQIWLTPGQQAVAGDRVIVAGERLAVEPAHGILRRRDARGRERTIAVNLDVLGIVVAPEPREPPGYIDRGFVIARAAGIEAVVIVNKLDLEGGRELADRLSEIYGASSHVHRVSATTGDGVETISNTLAGGRLGALVGPSGVGKSSLLNTLVPDLDLEVSELNRKSRKGRHTTTVGDFLSIRRASRISSRSRSMHSRRLASSPDSNRRSKEAVASAIVSIERNRIAAFSRPSKQARFTRGDIAVTSNYSTNFPGRPDRHDLPDRQGDLRGALN